MRTGSRTALVVVSLAALAAVAAPAAAQTDARSFFEPQSPMRVGPPLPPATLLEGFHAPVGAVVTVGHETLGEVKGISVEIRELRDSTGGRVRGAMVEVNQDKGQSQSSYID